MIGLREETPPTASPKTKVVAHTAEIFAEDGCLQDGLKLEHRPEQETMARAVAAALAAEASLLFEAGTGVGKSLAYLAPGIIHATDGGRQMIVSTHTIALQEQIEKQDLPLCRRLFHSAPELERYAGFEAAVLLGKSNYLCASRLSNALADRGTLLADADYAELERVAAWAETTATGLRHELRPAPSADVWDAVNADSSSCSRRHCDCNRCFYQKARARLRTAQVIIVNHALLFSLIGAGATRTDPASSEAAGVLFPADFVVLDEAHTVPEVAEQHFGLGVSSAGVERLLKHLYNPRTRRGLLARRGDAGSRQLAEDALTASAQFFGFLADTLLGQQPVVRLRQAGAAEALLAGPLSALERRVAQACDALEDGRERDELQDQGQRLKAVQASIDEWLNLADAGHVYWAERGGRQQTLVTLRSAPIDVAPELRRCLFGCGVSVVCTSATLAIGGEMERFAVRIGGEAARTGLARSPFDFERMMRVYVAADIPPPSAQETEPNLAALADYVGFCVERVKGGSLVLFTSYRDLRTVAALTEPGFRTQGRPVLLQGSDVSRTELVRIMRERGNAVLFGTDSFWTGIDVPGDALSQVIIARLPFAPPTHPIAEAKAEFIRERGGEPFSELTLPEALVKFRQGVGRLIRSKTDRGLITILDSRVLAKSYGRLFIGSLPNPEFQRLTRQDRETQFSPFV